MSEPQREDFAKMVSDLEEWDVSLHKQSLLLLQLGCMCQFTQLQRIRDGEQKTVEHFMGECIKAVHGQERVSHETLQS